MPNVNVLRSELFAKLGREYSKYSWLFQVAIVQSEILIIMLILYQVRMSLRICASSLESNLSMALPKRCK